MVAEISRWIRKMKIEGKALSRIDRCILAVGIPFGVGMFAVSVFYFFRDMSFWGLTLFSIPLSLFFLSLSLVGVMAQFCWVRVDDNKITYKGLLLMTEYKWREIEKTEFPFYLSGFTPYALFRLRNGKKKFVPCGDPQIKELISHLVIEEMLALSQTDKSVHTRSSSGSV